MFISLKSIKYKMCFQATPILRKDTLHHEILFVIFGLDNFGILL
uniref:Uncharacterized protein n=1 Tax=Arundo donax TaxID=35708 RepID=A0A0A9FXD8_ARUDO